MGKRHARARGGGGEKRHCSGGQGQSHYRGKYSPGRGASTWPAGAKGRPAVIGTCAQGKEKDAGRELIALLEASCERLGLGNADIASQDEEENDKEYDDSVEAQVKREVAALKKRGAGEAGSGLHYVPLNLRGVCAVSISRPGVNALAVTKDIFKRVSEEKTRLSRFLIRVQPLDSTCHAKLDDLVELAKPLILKSLGKDKPPVKWAFQVSRKNTSITRDDIIRELAPSADARHKVDLTNPSLMVIIEVCLGLAGVTIVENWDTAGFGGFHLRDAQNNVCGAPPEDKNDG